MSTVIKVENISKQYRLGKVGLGSLSHDINRWYQTTLRGKEDPYLKIGEANDRSVKGESDYVWALQDINFEVKQGEVLGIIGRNGAGKSTLLKILSRTTTPTTGQIKIKGRVASLLEVGTGFHPELTGRENIFLNGAILGMTRHEIKSKFDEIVDFAGVERYIDTPVKRYSSGMYVRLAFGVAAHLEPEILIVDEVLAVGDAEFQKKALGKMKDVSAKDGRTVLFVSHNMPAIKQLCDKSIVLVNGFIGFEGNVESGIEFYLSSNNDKEIDDLGSYYKINSRDDSAIELLEGQVVDINNNQKALFDSAEEIFLKFRIAKNVHIPNIKGYLVIKNREDDVFIETDTFDFLPNILETIDIGIHDFTLSIPKRILPNGKFLVYVNFTSEFSIANFNIHSPKEILNFEVSDMFTKRGQKRKARTNSIIQWKKIN
ncbi:MAG: ATP-binding cassette domain-containing protein [Spirosoma sp.]|uniref:ABC transporter ATP-binding protein n=1 Tax=Spirosoma sp. TaxID=1899569 RepID=UPI000AEFBEA6|nr:polysaccharide ABC transporter ATP-binding protein [Spirosoma sp.]MBN8827001.1 ATP-binding cassette domain-containing protein [Spirosoma sp.]MBN8834475.1 ATP-binding cassette domain-containing protein [Sphingobacteriales bacterium]